MATLSWKKGTPIAIGIGGAHNKQLLRIFKGKDDDEKKLHKILDSESDTDDEKPIRKGGKYPNKIKKDKRRKVESESEESEESGSEESEDEYCNAKCRVRGGCAKCLGGCGSKTCAMKGASMLNDESESDYSDDEEMIMENPMTLFDKKFAKEYGLSVNDLAVLKKHLEKKEKPKQRKIQQ